MKLTRRRLIQRTARAGGGIMAVMLLAACGQQAPAQPPTVSSSGGGTAVPSAAAGVATAVPRSGGTLVYARSVDAPAINPHQGNLAAHRVLSLVYDTLLRMDRNVRIVPGLATSWETPDPTTYVFHLRDNVKWHNGRAFEAADVKSSFEWLLDPKAGASRRTDWEIVDRIEVPDSRTVRFHLKSPNGGFLANVADIFAAIVPRELFEKDDPRQKALGTGPFKLDSWTRDNQMKLTRNADYYLPGQPLLDDITFQIIPDEGNIVAGLRGGTIDLTTFEDNKNYVLLKDQPGLNAMRSGRLGMDFLIFNCKIAPFDNQTVRQAVAYAVDRQEILQAALQGLGRLTGPLPEAMTEWALPAASFDTYKPNPDKARALLAEAGVPQGFKTDLMIIPTFPTMVSSAQVIASQLRKVGIEVNIQQVEYGLWLDRLNKTKDMPLTLNFTQGVADPDPYLYGRFHSKGFNQPNWNEPEVDQLLEQGRSTVDQGQRKEVYSRLQKMLADQKVPYIWLYSADLIDVGRQSVQGYQQHPSSFLFGLSETWVQK